MQSLYFATALRSPALPYLFHTLLRAALVVAVSVSVFAANWVLCGALGWLHP